MLDDDRSRADRHLSDDLREAWERVRETAAAFGDQRIYASGTAIMFSRDSCYFFVRPRRSFLEVCVFLGRAVRAPQVRRVERKSASKLVNIVQIRHRDEVEPPFTDWLQEAYELPDKLAARKAKPSRPQTIRREAQASPIIMTARAAAIQRQSAFALRPRQCFGGTGRGRQPTGVKIHGPAAITKGETVPAAVENHCGRVRRSRHIDDGSAAAACAGGRANEDRSPRDRNARSDSRSIGTGHGDCRERHAVPRRLRPRRGAARQCGGDEQGHRRAAAGETASRVRDSPALRPHRRLSRT